uniref:Proteasome assembly chaperone 1 n=1 Tax=Plectus sambesii TaxID=2011161 RepID=A0A914V753_9BILA
MSGPTFFGEVLPLNSRAGDVDADFETEEPANFSVSVDPEMPKKLDSCKLLLLAHGEHACCYIKAAKMETNHVADIVVASTFESAGAYRLVIESSSSGYLLALCQREIPSEYAYEVIELLMTSFTASPPEKCLILCSKATVLHRGEAAKSNISILSSTNAGSDWSSVTSMPYLTTPNTIDGLPAAALTFCELHKMSAVVMTSWYQSTGHSDLVQAARSFDAARKLSTVGDYLLTSSAVSENLAKLHPKNPQYFA